MSDSDFVPARVFPGPIQDASIGIPVRLVAVGSQWADRQWHQVRMANPFWRVYIADRPGLSLTTDRQTLRYRPDRITIIPAWLPFTFRMQDGIGHAFVHFELPHLSGPVVREHCRHALHLHDAPLLERFRAIAGDLGHARQDPVLLATRARALTDDIVVALFTAYAPALRERLLATPRRHLAPALDIIAARLDEPISVPQLAAGLGRSREHTIRLFKRYLGQTPAQYIQEQRVIRAAELLRATSDDLDTIARACGFGSRSYLSRVFSRRMGSSPARYRQRRP